jgi:hypothetical protein
MLTQHYDGFHNLIKPVGRDNSPVPKYAYAE